VPGCGAHAGVSADPVFVLCTSRSGSTLLRFLLDAHPDLACPPETRLPAILAQLSTLWSATEALPLSAGDGNGTAEIPEAAAAGIRHTMDLMIGPYLARRGKKRYCDKNLGTEQHADVLLSLYPEARFICLFRHPMDVIASGIEACPWGLGNYGYEPYAARAPGNSVLALARYWADHSAAILAVEDKFPGNCHRVRYEDLVADPDAVAGEIFGFLGLPPVAGISALCFSRERERSGPGDFKIWNTSQITGDSVGQGWYVPANLIPAPLTATINDLADRLGYVRIDGNWGGAHRPGDLRVSADGQAPERPSAPRGTGGPVPPGSLLVSERVQAGLRRLDEEFTREWKPYSDLPFLMVALAPASTDDSDWWLVDLTARKAVTGRGLCDQDVGWTVTAPAATWEQVIRDGTNMGTAFRRHGMRYRDKGDGGAGSITAENRVAMMSDLLGITTWRPGKGSAPAGTFQPDAEQRSNQTVTEEAPPAWQGSRHQPPPQKADLDVALWLTPPVRTAELVAQIGTSTARRPGPATTLVDESRSDDLPANVADPGAPASARKRLPGPEGHIAEPPLPPQMGSRGPVRGETARLTARERMRMERARRARRRLRTRVAAFSTGVVVLIVAAVTVGILLRHGRGAVITASSAYGGHYAPVTLNADNSVTMAQPGVTMPVLDVYEDFQCPVCRTFEKANGAVLQQLADRGKVKVVYHPFTVFSGEPEQGNSIRAWAAAKCVPANLWVRYHNALYASQPAETTVGGFPVSLLVRLGKNVGVTNPGFAQCVQSQKYALQNPPLSDQIINGGVNGMPTLKLNGQVLSISTTSSGLRQQILAAS
jgi:protein-disulfide isomerase